MVVLWPGSVAGQRSNTQHRSIRRPDIGVQAHLTILPTVRKPRQAGLADAQVGGYGVTPRQHCTLSPELGLSILSQRRIAGYHRAQKLSYLSCLFCPEDSGPPGRQQQFELLPTSRSVSKSRDCAIASSAAGGATT